MGNKLNTFGSVCSGLEAASFVLEPLGMSPLWLSEIADFPKRFLATKYPRIINLGDMNDIPQMIKEGDVDIPDFFCGGTPCQAFSLAGWKNGLNDYRGQLTLKYFDILNEIDNKRIANNKSRCVFLWENVEGVLKDKTNAFGYFLSGLLGLDNPIEVSKWTNAGLILGKERNVAWRILDAKYFGVPQQRKRLYVVGGGKDFNPLNVLFDNTEPFPDPLSTKSTPAASPSLFDGISNCIESNEINCLHREIDGCKFEVFRNYSDCLYAAYGTKWNGNAASFNGSLFVAQNDRVRRLTPTECERLMGFPDDYTALPNCKVTNRYQAIGNSWAVPVVKWICSKLENGFNPTVSNPQIQAAKLNNSDLLFLFDGFVPAEKSYLNANSYPSDYVLTNMLDIVDNEVDEKYYLSAAGCSGILRRKSERKANINNRLELLLKKSINHYSMQ